MGAPAVSSTTLAPSSAARRAADRPAAPEPITARSALSCSATGNRPDARGVPGQLAGARAVDRTDEAVQLAGPADSTDAGALADRHEGFGREQIGEGLFEI